MNSGFKQKPPTEATSASAKSRVAVRVPLVGLTLLGAVLLVGLCLLWVRQPGAQRVSVVVTAHTPGTDGTQEAPTRFSNANVERATAIESELPPVLAENINLRGTVLDVGGGPIAGALVTVGARGAPDVLCRTTSTADGGFGCSVPQGSAQLTAQAPAYALASITVEVPATDIELALTPAASAVGAVMSPTGEPVAGARVELREVSGLGVPSATQISASDGAFRFDAVSGGRYTLVATHDQGRSSPLALQVFIGQQHGPLTLVLRPGVPLTAEVQRGGIPCDEGRVSLAGDVQLSARVEQGRAQIPGIPAGTYQARITCEWGGLGRAETLEVGSSALHKSWNLDAGASVRGTVVDDAGAPVVQATIMLSSLPPSTGGEGTRCTSDESGSFICSGLAPGDYECVVWQDGQTLSVPVTVHLTEAGADVELRTRATAAIHVHVAQSTDLDAQRWLVLARSADGTTRVAERRGAEFHFEKLLLGEYHVYLGPSAEAEGTEVAVHLDQPAQIANVEVSPPTGQSISGVVLDAEGNPCVDAWVSLRSSDALWGITKRGTPTLTNTDGAFAFSGLLPGSYELQVEHQGRIARLHGVRGGEHDVIARLDSNAEARSTPPLNDQWLENNNQ